MQKNLNLAEVLRALRHGKSLSVAEVVLRAGVPRIMVESLETNSWRGISQEEIRKFLENLAGVYKVDAHMLLSQAEDEMARPPVLLEIFPLWKKLIGFWSWGYVGRVLIVLSVCGLILYSGFQFWSTHKSPTLVILQPQDWSLVSSDFIAISGQSDPDAQILINSVPVAVGGDGYFTTVVSVSSGQVFKFTVMAKNRFNKFSKKDIVVATEHPVLLNNF